MYKRIKRDTREGEREREGSHRLPYTINVFPKHFLQVTASMTLRARKGRLMQKKARKEKMKSLVHVKARARGKGDGRANERESPIACILSFCLLVVSEREVERICPCGEKHS
ncbi:hypothetical protein M408DRAFT_190152 [Serendipita vermifera MAFF 305830]|uniref:Uncharacterized protein n=1 Tax=Serendipita vermifera MAFF 305830 TaxID=933852 RepID=A0A0C2XVR9_SERVB|nr:hypothetical protein M408DRAFT_190152 [Serendipita vermifera MAFF 305830]